MVLLESAQSGGSDERSVRDAFIEAEETRWNDAAKQEETIAKEKREMAEGLAAEAAKIEAGIAKMEMPLAREGELPQFLRACGVGEETVQKLEKALGQQTMMLAPKAKHGIAAVFATVNELFAQKGFTEGTFSNRVLESFERERLATFVADDIAYVKDQDRRGEGFYRSEEGVKFMAQGLSGNSL